MSQIINLNTSGGQNLPTLPAFLSAGTTSTANQTGDQTLVTVGVTAGEVWTTVYDQVSNLSGGTSAALTFTAPKTGKYLLTFNLIATGTSAFSTVNAFIVTTARTYSGRGQYATATISELFTVSLAVIADMTATNTAIYQYSVGGIGSKLAAWQAGTTSTLNTYISGYFVA